jgi:hypothetical protein
MTLPFASFFEAVQNPAFALVFTTFSLDEQVLVKLLRRFKVESSRRIVVFHDIMKHQFPGLLHQHYTHSLVVSVQLINTRGPSRSCPVFHSKLWMGIERRPFRCRVLAVPSLNLRRYHLDEVWKTFESFAIWPDVSLGLGELEWMNKDLIFSEEHAHVRCKINCGTVFVDARRGLPFALRSSNTPAIQIIEKHLKGESLHCCAAPFASQRAIERLLPTKTLSGKRPAVWVGSRPDGTCLHAKLIESSRSLILGSTNMTCQALGIGRFLNHETVVVERRGSLRLSKLLRGFPRRYKLPDTPEEPGDRDETDPAIENWAERRRLAVNGPVRVELFLSSMRAGIRIVGPLGGAAAIVIASKSERVPSISAPAHERLTFPSDAAQLALAQLLLSPLVEVKGLRRGTCLWIRALDCGSFWTVLEANATDLGAARKTLGGAGTRHGLPPKHRIKHYQDVRLARIEAYQNPILDDEYRDWQNWLTHLSHGLPLRGMPAWCVNLASQIRKIERA